MADDKELLVSCINPEAWVRGCIEKVKLSDDWKSRWNSAWFETYVELGGVKIAVE